MESPLSRNAMTTLPQRAKQILRKVHAELRCSKGFFSRIINGHLTCSTHTDERN